MPKSCQSCIFRPDADDRNGDIRRAENQCEAWQTETKGQDDNLADDHKIVQMR